MLPLSEWPFLPFPYWYLMWWNAATWNGLVGNALGNWMEEEIFLQDSSLLACLLLSIRLYLSTLLLHNRPYIRMNSIGIIRILARSKVPCSFQVLWRVPHRLIRAEQRGIYSPVTLLESWEFRFYEELRQFVWVCLCRKQATHVVSAFF